MTTELGLISTLPTVLGPFALLVLVGGLMLRYVWIVAGRASADDAQATHRCNAMEWHESRRRV